jgi:endonuclease/exonuclease/phosphatase (EEP) superfamily protein YafD
MKISFPGTTAIVRLVWAAVVVYTGLMLLWSMLRYYPGDRWLIVRLGSYFAPWLGAGLLISLVAALLARRVRLALMVLVTVAMTGLHFTHLLPASAPPANAQQPERTIKVLTLNIHYQNRRADAVTALIQKEQPTLVAFQELIEPLRTTLPAQLAEEYPHQLSDGNGLTIISRYPLEAVVSPPEVGRAQQAMLHLPEQPVRVWNVHTSVGVNQRGWQAQNQTLAALSRQVSGTTTPTIVLGDFNTTVYAENYDIITTELRNAAQPAGSDFPFTFPHPDFIREVTGGRAGFDLIAAVGPVVRIDHILVTDHFTPVYSHVVPDYLGSDHYPVITTLAY